MLFVREKKIHLKDCRILKYNKVKIEVKEMIQLEYCKECHNAFQVSSNIADAEKHICSK